MAAAVAAAIAALILELARAPAAAGSVMLDEEKLQYLHTPSGMYQVFKEMWKSDERRRYIKPWSLVTIDHPEGQRDDAIARQECLKDLARCLRR
jgi:hypothetical protein